MSICTSPAATDARLPPPPSRAALNDGRSAGRPPVTGVRSVVLLVMGPERTVRWRIEMGLRMAGYQVVLADDSTAAWGRLVEGLRPDLLLCDVHVPGVADGSFAGLARRHMRGGPIVVLGPSGGCSDRELLDRFERLPLRR